MRPGQPARPDGPAFSLVKLIVKLDARSKSPGQSARRFARSPRAEPQNRLLRHGGGNDFGSPRPVLRASPQSFLADVARNWADAAPARSFRISTPARVAPRPHRHCEERLCNGWGPD